MTKLELIKKRGLEDKEARGELSYDTALPQDWVDEVVSWTRKTWSSYYVKRGIGYHEIIYGFVWVYDQKSRVFGRPCPLTPVTHWLLGQLPRRLYGERDD